MDALDKAKAFIIKSATRKCNIWIYDCSVSQREYKRMNGGCNEGSGRRNESQCGTEGNQFGI